MMMSILLPASVYAANPFLDALNDKPVVAKFRGTQWSDDIGDEEIPLTARVVTTRLARRPWGAIFKIEFTDLKSRAEKQREIRADYFIVTDNRIVLLNEEDNEAAAKKISLLDNSPEFEPNDTYGITSGSFEHQEGEWKTTIKLKGDLCIYECHASLRTFQKNRVEKSSGIDRIGERLRRPCRRLPIETRSKPVRLPIHTAI